MERAFLLRFADPALDSLLRLRTHFGSHSQNVYTAAHDMA
jgi:hypothetical protein